MSGLRPPPFKRVVMLTPALGCLGEKMKKFGIVIFLSILMQAVFAEEPVYAPDLTLFWSYKAMKISSN